MPSRLWRVDLPLPFGPMTTVKRAMSMLARSMLRKLRSSIRRHMATNLYLFVPQRPVLMPNGGASSRGFVWPALRRFFSSTESAGACVLSTVRCCGS